MRQPAIISPNLSDVGKAAVSSNNSAESSPRSSRQREPAANSSAIASKSASKKSLTFINDSSEATLPGIEANSRISSADSNALFDIAGLIRSSSSLFSYASDQFILDMEKRMSYRYLSPGDQVIKQGELGKAMFFIIRGSCIVSSRDGDSVFAELGAGSFFGEIGVLFEIPRTANVSAKTKCLVAALTRAGLNELLSSYPEMADELLLEAIQRYEDLQQKTKRSNNSPESDLVVIAKQITPTKPTFMHRLYEFQYLPKGAVEKISQTFTPIRVQENTTVLKEGTMSDRLYIVISGVIDVFDESNSLVGNMPSGTWFGELGIYAKKSCAYSYIANSGNRCSIISLSKEQLESFVSSNASAFPDLKSRIDKTIERSRHLYEMINRRKSSKRNELLRKTSQVSSSALSAITDMNLEKQFDADLNSSSLFGTRKSSKAETVIPEETDDLIIVEPIEENETSSDEDSEEMAPVIDNKRLFPGLALETGRRRASIAVWADSKLSEIAAQQAAKLDVKRDTRQRHIEIKNIDSSTESIAEEPESKDKIIFDEPAALELIFSKLSFKIVWKLRHVSKTWKRIIESSKHIAKQIDTSSEHNKVDDETIETLSSSLKSNIEILILKNCWKLTNKSLNSIATNCPSLLAIDLSGCWDITDEGLIALSLGCRNIKSIDLSNCRKITDRGIASLMMNCNSLSDIFLSYCKALTDQIFVLMRDHCPNIRRINIQRCIGITDNGLAQFSHSKHLKLQELILSDCSFLSDNAMKSIAESCPNLRILNISFCCALTETGMQNLVDGCQKLEIFDSSFCGNAVSDEILSNMAKKWNHLQRLSIRGCIRVTDTGVQELFKNCTELKRINISNCKGTTKPLLQNMPSHIKLLDANDSIISNSSITTNETFGSNHIRRYTAP